MDPSTSRPAVVIDNGTGCIFLINDNYPFEWRRIEFDGVVEFGVAHEWLLSKVKFETGCFHPNVDVFGNIFLDILQEKWSSAYDMRTILLSFQSLLEEYRKMVEKLYKLPTI
ncbi:hypothetical protein Droror1_Dr00025558 [Drosera rotundifolia]